MSSRHNSQRAATWRVYFTNLLAAVIWLATLSALLAVGMIVGVWLDGLLGTRPYLALIASLTSLPLGAYAAYQLTRLVLGRV
jgi:hypothetical protein